MENIYSFLTKNSNNSIPSYLNTYKSSQGGTKMNELNTVSVMFFLILLLEYLIILGVKYLMNIKIILNTTKDHKRFD